MLNNLKLIIHRSLNSIQKTTRLINLNSLRIQKLKNIHKGKTAILLGNGPSVDIKDFSLFSNQIIFACNRFYISYDLHDLRPEYLCCADEQMYIDFGDELEKQNSILLLSIRKKLKRGSKALSFPVNSAIPFFSHPLLGINRSGSTLIFACQVGYFMGIRKFILYGVDHSFNFKNLKSKEKSKSVYGEGNHFIDDYRNSKAWWPPATSLIEKGFKELSKSLNSKPHSFMINCSRNTRLPYIPKKPLREVLQVEKC